MEKVEGKTYLLNAIEADFSNISRYSGRIPSSHDVLCRALDEIKEKESHRINPEQRIDILRRNFRPIPATPKNGGLYRIAYVYPEHVPKELSLDPNPFQSPYSNHGTPQVINDPKVLAEDIARLFACCASGLRSDMRKRECYLISGERGVGKTAFLNYIFSTQHSIFDKEKVVWVRLDLTLAQALGMNILEFLAIHTHDIFCKYYMKRDEYPYKNEFFDDEDYDHCIKEFEHRASVFSLAEFKHFLEDIPKEDIALRDIADQLLLLDDKTIFNMPISNAERRKRVTLFRLFANRQGYSFIYVIDGLDEATIPMQELDVLQVWKENVTDIIQGKNIPEGLYVICARHESFRTLARHMQSLNVVRNLRQFVVFPTTMKCVIDQRLEVFTERIKRQGKDLSVEHWTYDSAKLIVDWTRYAIKCALDDVGIEHNILEEFAKSGHMRSILKFFRDAIWETVAILDENYSAIKINNWLPVIASLMTDQPNLDGEIKRLLKRKSYRIWSLSSLNYENHYEKSIELLPGMRKLSSPDVSGEFPLIPVVWGDLSFQRNEGYFNNYLMAKVRILQLLYFHRDKHVTFKEVKRTICIMFQYNPENIDLILRAMMLQRLVDYEPNQDIFQGLEESTIRLTDIGKRLISEWIYIPAYVEYTMQLCAIPSLIVDEFPRFFIRRSSGPMANKSNYRAPEYLARLFPSLAKFVGLIFAIEEWEFTRLVASSYISETAVSEIESILIFEPEWIALKLADALKKQAVQIIQNAERVGYPKVLAELSAAYKVN